MKLIFMGTPDFAVPSLNAVCEAGHTVQLVITQPDKPKGRKLVLTPPPVKARALELGLQVEQPETMRDESILAKIAALDADAIIVAAYGKILRKDVLEATRLGCINVHSSLLPRYRGAAPINWAVINGEKVSGVSTMQLDEGVDTGDILLQAETPIDPDETAGELHDRLAQMGAELLIKTLELAEKGQLMPDKQDDSLSCYAPMLDKTLSVIDWSKTAQQVHDLVRGIQPWPVAQTKLSGSTLKVHKTRVVEGKGECGEVICANPLTVACGDGAVEIIELQAEGGKRMAASDYLRGHPIEKGIVLG